MNYPYLHQLDNHFTFEHIQFKIDHFTFFIQNTIKTIHRYEQQITFKLYS